MEILSVTLGLVAGAAVGAAVGYWLADRRARALQTTAAVAEQRAAGMEAQLAAAGAEMAQVREQLSACEKGLAAQAAQLDASQANLTQQRQLLADAHAQLTAAFAAVSQDALAKAQAAFLQLAEAKFQTLSTSAATSLDQRKAQIETLLKPLQHLLDTYQQRLTDIEKSRNESYGALQKQIGQISEIERTLAAQTSQLVSALTRPNVRGQWGEITLRRLVELAGLSNRCDFLEQATTQDSEGARLRPDMLIQLPASRCIVIDAKAVLAAFLDAAAATDDAVRQGHLQRHAQLVRTRAKDLASKAYWAQFATSPEFVVLFLPGESFLYAAVEHDPGLIEDCLANKVILATPTTLLALLKTVEYGWRQEALSENADAIRKLGTEIYDRLAVLAAHMAKLGTSLDGSVKAYNDALASLESRLLVSARKMADLGVSPTRPLPEDVTAVDRRPNELSSTLHPGKTPLWPE